LSLVLIVGIFVEFDAILRLLTLEWHLVREHLLLMMLMLLVLLVAVLRGDHSLQLWFGDVCLFTFAGHFSLLLLLLRLNRLCTDLDSIKVD